MLRTVAGGELLAFGSAWPKIEERYLRGSLGSILDEVRQKRG